MPPATEWLITHYHHLLAQENYSLREAIVRGSMERLSPVLMTSVVTGVGLIPLALGKGTPGKEIQQPMAVVILGGIVTSTLLNMIVIPALYLRVAKPGMVERPASTNFSEVAPNDGGTNKRRD